MKIKRLRLLFLCMVLLAVGSKTANARTFRLYMNPGSFRTVDTMYFPYIAFNIDTVFSPKNAVIRALVDETIKITVHNKDKIAHSFAFPGYPAPAVIKAGDSASYNYKFGEPKTYIFYDGESFPKYCYLGLAGMVIIEKPGVHLFSWNIKEHEMAFNKTLGNDSAVDWKKYDPDYFTINGLSFPDLEMDSTAIVKGKVGDTIHIALANTGRSIHSIHFHGFHTRAIAATNKRLIGWEKDSWNIGPLETILLELVPDKTGDYPVHDHNLAAQVGGGHYPNGMMTMIKIK